MLMMTACYLKDRRLVQVRKQNEAIDPEKTYLKTTVTLTASSQSQSTSHGSGATTPCSAPAPRALQ